MDYARIFKALGDKTRLEIVVMLADGEKCACKVLEKFNFTQPTLSHHMKILCDCGIVTSRKEGKWTYYSLSESAVWEIIGFLKKLTNTNP
ncbi:MAG: winged helix-turn-helix transcriptional regulator [Ruminococcus sp.]|nr:winged helix-turn-helix transcriptional regulator [Ruminococcus sp.]